VRFHTARDRLAVTSTYACKVPPGTPHGLSTRDLLLRLHAGHQLDQHDIQEKGPVVSQQLLSGHVVIILEQPLVKSAIY
jgi:hypothetical protein